MSENIAKEYDYLVRQLNIVEGETIFLASNLLSFFILYKKMKKSFNENQLIDALISMAL